MTTSLSCLVYSDLISQGGHDYDGEMFKLKNIP